jgi:hypothetical protein
MSGARWCSAGWLDGSGGVGPRRRETRPIALRLSALALAAGRAPISINRIPIVALLSQGWVPFSISTPCRRRTPTDDVRKSNCTIAKRLTSVTDNVLRNGQGLEPIDPRGRILGEGLMHTAAPVRERGIVKGTKCRGRGDNMCGVVTVKVPTHVELAEFREASDVTCVHRIPVMREGEVQTSGRGAGIVLAGSGEFDAIVDEIPCTGLAAAKVVAWVGPWFEIN